MPWVEFGHTVPASERAKTVHALDRSATVTGNEPLGSIKYWEAQEGLSSVSEWSLIVICSERAVSDDIRTLSP
jgi:hypothetical protein